MVATKVTTSDSERRESPRYLYCVHDFSSSRADSNGSLPHFVRSMYSDPHRDGYGWSDRIFVQKISSCAQMIQSAYGFDINSVLDTSYLFSFLQLHWDFQCLTKQNQNKRQNQLPSLVNQLLVNYTIRSFTTGLHCYQSKEEKKTKKKQDFIPIAKGNSDNKMGCGSSKSGLQHVDDSVHVMLAHDKKVQQRKGQTVHGYKERAQHPLLQPKAVNTPEPTNGTNGGGPVATEE